MERIASRQHVMVLEDDPSISELLTWILSDAGYDVTAIDSVREARRACADVMPDVIIADLLLPDGLGSDLIHEITQSNERNSPATVIMSAVPQAPQRAEAAGAQLCITKPFDLAELLDAIAGLAGSDSMNLQPH